MVTIPKNQISFEFAVNKFRPNTPFLYCIVPSITNGIVAIEIASASFLQQLTMAHTSFFTPSSSLKFNSPLLSSAPTSSSHSHSHALSFPSHSFLSGFVLFFYYQFALFFVIGIYNTPWTEAFLLTEFQSVINSTFWLHIGNFEVFQFVGVVFHCLLVYLF